MENRNKLFCLTLMLAILLSLAAAHTAFAKTANPEDRQQSYTYILKNVQDTNKVEHIVNDLYPDMKVEAVQEVGVITINFNHEEQIKHISREISSFIEAQGKMPAIAEPSELRTTEVNPAAFSTSGETKAAIQGSVQRESTVNFPELKSPYFLPFNWYLADITADYKTESIETGDYATVALIDSGVDLEHPLLKDNISLELAKNYVDNEESVQDEQGHGTQVAGIIASIAPNSEIVPYKVLGETDGESAWVIEAIIDAAKDDMDVINLSLGTYKSKAVKEEKVLMKAYDRAIKYAKKKGSVVVASVGNHSYNLDERKENREFHLPGGLHPLISVSSTSKRDTLASYSNYGKEVDFSAPGGDMGAGFENTGMIDITEMIITTYPSGVTNTLLDQLLGVPQGYTVTMGSSLAAPQVSAAAALLISEYEEKTGKQLQSNKVEKYLEKGSIDLGTKGKDVYFGAGKINIYHSLREVK